MDRPAGLDAGVIPRVHGRILMLISLAMVPLALTAEGQARRPRSHGPLANMRADIVHRLVEASGPGFTVTIPSVGGVQPSSVISELPLSILWLVACRRERCCPPLHRYDNRQESRSPDRISPDREIGSQENRHSAKRSPPRGWKAPERNSSSPTKR
jgi:hypothetical protein